MAINILLIQSKSKRLASLYGVLLDKGFTVSHKLIESNDNLEVNIENFSAVVLDLKRGEIKQYLPKLLSFSETVPLLILKREEIKIESDKLESVILIEKPFTPRYIVSEIEKTVYKNSFEKQKKSRESLYGSLFNTMASAIAIYETPNGGETFLFKDLNPTAERVSKITLSEVKGKSVEVVFPAIEEIGLLSLFREVYKTGKSEKLPLSHYKDDRIEQWVENFVYKLPTADIVAVYTDVSERQKTYEQIKTQAHLLETVSDSVIAIDLEYKIESWNKASEGIFNKSFNSVKGKRLCNALQFEVSSGSLEEAIDSVVEKGNWEGEITIKNEPEQYLFSSVSMVRDSEGIPTGIVAVNRDITEKKMADKALEENRKLYMSIFRSSPLALIITSASGTIIDWNNGAERVFGWRKEEVVGKKREKFLHSRIIKSTGEAGGLTGVFPKYAKYQNTTKDGKIITCEWYSDTITDSHGEPNIIVLVANDISERVEAESNLLKSEKKFRDIITRLPVGFIEITSNNCIEYINAAGAKILSIRETENEISANEFSIENNGKPVILSKVLSKSASSSPFPAKLIRRNGKTVEILLSVFPYFEDGRLAGTRAILVDITDESRRQNEIENQKRMLEMIAEFQRSIYSLDTGEVIEETLKFLSKFCDAASFILLQEDGYVKYKIHELNISKERGSKDDLRPSIKKALMSQEPSYNPSAIDEKTNEKSLFRSEYMSPLIFEKHPEGLIILKSKQVDSIDENTRRAVKIITPSVSLALVNSSYYEEIQASEQRYRTLFEYATEAILLIDAETFRYADANANAIALLQTSLGELIQNELGDFSSPFNVSEGYSSSRALLRAKLKEALTNEVFISEWIIRNKKNEDIPCQIRMVRFPGGIRKFVRISIIDISEQKRLLKERRIREQMLIQTDKLTSLGNLAAGVAHEIGQPLTGISLALGNMERRAQKGKADGHYISKKSSEMLEYVKRIKSIIEHIRTFSREQKEEREENFSINKAIENALSLVRTQYIQHEVKLIVSLDESISPIAGNIYKVEQVILNLVSNAKDSVDERAQREAEGYEKRIQITSRMKDDKLVVVVEDNGIGMPQHVLDEVFTPFFTTKPVDKGTGLGMSVSYGIVHSMGGEIILNSEENEYTKVFVSFPIKKENRNETA